MCQQHCTTGRIIRSSMGFRLTKSNQQIMTIGFKITLIITEKQDLTAAYSSVLRFSFETGQCSFSISASGSFVDGKGHMLKEPTNEEMALTANLAISYGAKGLMYFAWGSSNSTYDTARVDSTGPVICSRGLVNTDYTPRRLNVYGQNKWEAIKYKRTRKTYNIRNRS